MIDPSVHSARYRFPIPAAERTRRRSEVDSSSPPGPDGTLDTRTSKV
jgi:hypothetical protein